MAKAPKCFCRGSAEALQSHCKAIAEAQAWVTHKDYHLASYIERLGTGTSDMVDECVAMGLKAPEFIQDSNFRAILWRKKDLSSNGNALSSEKNDLTSTKNALSLSEKALSSNENALSSNENALSSTIKLNKKQKI